MCGFFPVRFTMALCTSSIFISFLLSGFIFSEFNIFVTLYVSYKSNPFPKYLSSEFSDSKTTAHVPCFSHSCLHKELVPFPPSILGQSSNRSLLIGSSTWVSNFMDVLQNAGPSVCNFVGHIP